MKLICSLAILALINISAARSKTADKRWKTNRSGSISWYISDRLPHADHIEMSGGSISAILNYEVTVDQKFKLSRKLGWPMLRTIPNDTRGSLIRVLEDDLENKINVNGQPINGIRVSEIRLNGLMTVKSSGGGIGITRVAFPSTKHLAFFESYILKNNSENPFGWTFSNISPS